MNNLASNFLPYARQAIDEEDVRSVSEALVSDMITRGPKVEEFEKAVADYCGAKFAVAFNSGTTALMAACHAGKVGPHDRVISTPNSFVASIGAGIAQGATPVFIDIDRHTGNWDLNQLEANINRSSSRGKAVLIPVHFAGIPVDMYQVDRMIQDPETLVIEDAAHAIGSSYAEGQKVGSCAYSQMTIFSFHPAKTITTGEGGMVTTNDDNLYRLLKLYRNNGMERDPKFLQQPPAPWYYEVQEFTGGFNFTEFQAALGLSQLKRIDKFVSKRRQLMAAYRKKLKNFPHLRLFTAEFDKHVAFHLCVAQIDFTALKTTRTEVMEKLKSEGIGTQVHYIPIYRFPFFAEKSGDISEYFPEMEAYYSQALSLPLYPALEEKDIDRVVTALKKVLARNY